MHQLMPWDIYSSDNSSGVQLVLYTICALYLWNHSTTGGKKFLFLLGYVTLLLIWETIFCIVQARTVQDIYVDNRNYPGGPWAYFLATQSKAENVIFFASLFVLTFLSDLLVVSPIFYQIGPK